MPGRVRGQMRQRPRSTGPDAPTAPLPDVRRSQPYLIGRAPDGKRLQRKYAFDRKKDTEAELAPITHTVRTGEFVDRSKITVAELIDRYRRHAAGTITIAQTRPVVEGKVIVKAPKSRARPGPSVTSAASLRAVHTSPGEHEVVRPGGSQRGSHLLGLRPVAILVRYRGRDQIFRWPKTAN